MPLPVQIAVTVVPSYDGCCAALPVRALSRHRLTADEYRRLRNAQDGLCAICRQPHVRSNALVPLYIDHDHACCPDHHNTCGRCVRGLLCSGCNGFLGEMELWGRRPGLEDYEWWWFAARDYLARAGCDPDDPARVEALAARHVARRARLGMPCSCRHCDSLAGRT